MQEPVTSESADNEMEDVLSSIRRLVAQGSRKGRIREDEPRPAGKMEEKFVLTPNFRIGEPPAERTPSPAARQSVIPPAATAPESAGASAGDSLPDRTRSSIAELERTILELEAAIGEQNIEFEPDGSEDPAQEAATAVPLPRLHLQAQEAVEVEEAVEAEEAAARTGEESRPCEEPAQDPAPDFSSTRAPHQAGAENGAPGEAPAIQAEESEAGTDGQAETFPMLDEETLRGIIHEVLQEELRGDLGLRITRNVRKLVRREIRRTLESLGIE